MYLRPELPVILDQSHPLVKDLRDGWLFTAFGWNSFTGRHSLTASNVNKTTDGELSQASPATELKFVNFEDMTSDTIGTVVVKFRMNSAMSVANVAPIFSFGGPDEAVDSIFQIDVRRNAALGNGSSMYFDTVVRESGTALRSAGGTTTAIISKTWYTAAMTLTAANGTPELYVNGIAQTLDAWTGATNPLPWLADAYQPGGTGWQARIGSGHYQGVNNALDVEIEFVYYFKSRLTANEIRSLTAAPYQIFQDYRRPMMLDAATSDPIGPLIYSKLTHGLVNHGARI